MKYKEWLEIWLANYVKPSAKQRTYETYRQMVEKRIALRIGEYELDELSPTIMQTFITEQLNCGNFRTGKGLSANTVNLMVTILQNSLKVAFLLGHAKSYNGSKLKRPKLKQKNVLCFSVVEQKKIEQAVAFDCRSKMFGIVLCLYTGLRVGELLALRWDDIDFQKKLLYVNSTCYDGKTENGFGRIIGEPKTESSKRIVPIPKQLIVMLKQLKRKDNCEYVISMKGKPLSVRSYQNSFTLLLKQIKIEYRGFHSLRHTFATRAIECGMDVKTLSEILGHKSATVTLNRYAHSLMEHKTDMMNKLGKLYTQNEKVD